MQTSIINRQDIRIIDLLNQQNKLRLILFRKSEELAYLSREINHLYLETKTHERIVGQRSTQLKGWPN
jgi:hypothetical protein